MQLVDDLFEWSWLLVAVTVHYLGFELGLSTVGPP
jgi:hypothetical protein